MNMRTIPLSVLERSHVTGFGPFAVVSMCEGKMKAERKHLEARAEFIKQAWNRVGCGCASCRNEHYTFRVDEPLPQAILSILHRENGEPMRPRLIAEELGLDSEMVGKKVAALARAGKAASVGHGLYVIAQGTT